jgi:hypothetical protein
MRAYRYLRHFGRTALWSVACWVGIFVPAYAVVGIMWRYVGFGSQPSGDPVKVLGAVIVMYLSMSSTLLVVVFAYAPVLALAAHYATGRRLLLLSVAAAFSVPGLAIGLKLSRYVALVADWPATIVATVVFGLLCGQIVRSRTLHDIVD